MAPTRDIIITIPIPTIEGITAVLTEVYRAVTAVCESALGYTKAPFLKVVEHNILSAFVLILWSFYPKHGFIAIYFIVWQIPKNIGLILSQECGQEGVEQGDTHASTHKSSPNCGDHIPKVGVVAVNQSYGTTGVPGDHRDDYFESDADEEKLGLFYQVFRCVLFIGGILLLLPEK